MLTFTEYMKLVNELGVSISQRIDISTGNILLYIEDRETKAQCIKRVSKDTSSQEIEQIIKEWKESLRRDSSDSNEL